MSYAHRLRRIFTAIGFICGCFCLLAAPVFANDKVEGKKGYVLNSGDELHTPQEICAIKAKERGDDKFVDNPLNQVAGAKADDGSVWCKLTNAKGDEDEQHYGMEDWECPPNSERINYGCECKEGYEAAGNTCKIHRNLSKEELLATPQIHNPYDCKMSKEKYDALNAVLGKKFDNVPYLKETWNLAAKIEPGLNDTVAALKPTGNQDNRKYFDTVRNNFWDILAGRDSVRKKIATAGEVFPEQSVADARKTFSKAGITIPENEKPTGKKRAELVEINGKQQQVDVDHIVGFAEDPTQMISSSNLQLSPMKENRRSLEEIARKDMFYDPAAYLEAEKKKMEKNGSNCQ